MIVVDASALVPALADDGAPGAVARAALAGNDLAAPHLIDIEVTSAVRRLTAAGLLSVERAERALTDLIGLSLVRAPQMALLARCWVLRDNLTPYDAAYVALAESFDLTLVTADARLASAPGPRCRFEVLSV